MKIPKKFRTLKSFNIVKNSIRALSDSLIIDFINNKRTEFRKLEEWQKDVLISIANHIQSAELELVVSKIYDKERETIASAYQILDSYKDDFFDYGFFELWEEFWGETHE